MTWRKRPAPPAVDWWEDEGRRLAPLLDATSAAVVVGKDGDAAARVALGMARAITALERRVAIADLTGAAPTLATLAGEENAPGITDSFLHGISLNDVARPAADGTPSLFILPCGSGQPVPEEVLQSDRWHRLAAGFADAGALLLLVAVAGTPGLSALVMQTDGAVSVGDADLPIEWRVIAQAGDSVRSPTRAAPRAATHRTRRRRPAVRIVAGGVLLAAIIVAGSALSPRVAGLRGRLTAREAAPKSPPAAASAVTPAVAPVAVPADTVSVSAPVNPADSAIAAEFAVELVATNTAAGANSWLRDRGAQMPGVTVTPVLLGAGRERWHRVLAGAWRARAGADSMLASLREAGVLREGTGLVVRVPLALLLEAGVPRSAAPGRTAALVARGIPAYALLQDDGTARLFAGAFESAVAAVPFGADLRAAGLSPQLAYRTGRTF